MKQRMCAFHYIPVLCVSLYKQAFWKKLDDIALRSRQHTVLFYSNQVRFLSRYKYYIPLLSGTTLFQDGHLLHLYDFWKKISPLL